jgi:hypothetical protein
LLRAQIIEVHRKKGIDAGVLSARLDYPDMREAADSTDALSSMIPDVFGLEKQKEVKINDIH